MAEHKELVERLREIETGSITENGEFSVNWCRNPDGHEAARIIEAQAAEIAKFREGIAEGKETALELAHIIEGQAVLLEVQKGPKELVAKSRILSAEYKALSAEYEALSRRLSV